MAFTLVCVTKLLFIFFPPYHRLLLFFPFFLSLATWIESSIHEPRIRSSVVRSLWVAGTILCRLSCMGFIHAANKLCGNIKIYRILRVLPGNLSIFMIYILSYESHPQSVLSRDCVALPNRVQFFFLFFFVFLTATNSSFIYELNRPPRGVSAVRRNTSRPSYIQIGVYAYYNPF